MGYVMRYTMGLWNIIILWDMMGFSTRMTGTTMGNGWKIFGLIFDDMFFHMFPFWNVILLEMMTVDDMMIQVDLILQYLRQCDKCDIHR